MIKLIILLMISVSFSFGLTNEQIQKIQDVYTIGKNIKTSDGHTFEKTLVGIMGQESDWGDFFNYKKTKESQLKSPTSSIGDFQIQLATAQEVIKSDETLLKKILVVIRSLHQILLFLILMQRGLAFHKYLTPAA